MLPKHYTRIVFAERPLTNITSTTFRKETVTWDLKPGPSEVLIRVDWISLDPVMRTWLTDAGSYGGTVQIGEVMRSIGLLGTIVEVGEGSRLRPGDVVSSHRGLGWTEYGVVKEEDVQVIHVLPGVQLLDFLGPLGKAGGVTAYFGMLEVGKIKSGETLVVSAAAGSVGALACQIGKLHGAKVIGIAGTDEKCRWLREVLKIDAAINYKSPTFRDEFVDAVGCFDVFFDNVGGEILDFALTRLKPKARVVLCGAISTYNTPEPKGISSYFNLVVQGAKIEGFTVRHYTERFPEALRDLSKWISEGRIIRNFHVVEGLEKAPEAFNMLFTGDNTGKLVVRVSGQHAGH